MKSSLKMKNKCLVCGHNYFLELYDGTLSKCKSCMFVTANLNISDKSLNKIYDTKYFKGAEYADYLKDKEIIQKNFVSRLKFIEQNFGLKKVKNVLEIGSAYGFFAEILTGMIKSARFTGLDISKEAIKYGKSYLKQNLICGDYLLQPAPRNKYSDVFMWDVIEHLKSPDKVISKISKEIEDDGRFFITTGDIDAWLPKMQRQNWRMIHPPSHLHYFSKITISKLLEKNGFKIVCIKYPSISRSIRVIFYSLFLLNKKPNNIISKIYNFIPKKWYLNLNSFDIMFIIAQKNKLY